MKIKLTVSYDGTNYCGWQIQPNGTSVQGVIEEAIFRLTGEKVSITGSGRTDAGVHAKGQVASFETQSKIPPENFYKALNTLLPPDVKAVKSELVADDFNACRNAKKKTYTYSMYISDVELPLKERYSVRVEKGLDVKKMKKAGKLLVGEHDFKSFCSTGSEVKTTVRKIYSLKVKKTKDDLKISITGNGFLYKMVRSIVGVIIAVGQGKLTESDITQMLKTGERNLESKTFPAKGLTLMKVEY